MAKQRPSSFKEPKIFEMATQKMAIIRIKSDPNAVSSKYLPALYTSVYGLKKILKAQGKDFKVSKLRARWPGAENLPKDQWIGVYGLPIPDDTTNNTGYMAMLRCVQIAIMGNLIYPQTIRRNYFILRRQ
jgi:hypothetical protein